jgi:8-oxo-dGTP pyrophosphatase MutT (NUDIX family)
MPPSGGAEPVKLPVEHHYSSGGAIVREGAVCLIKPQGRDRWQLPKGHIDPGEKAAETAVREVLEETGHRGTVRGDKLGDVEYWYVEKRPEGSARVHKKVSFFLLELVKEDERAPDPVEVAEARFFPLDEAIAKIAFASERAILEKARVRLAE